MAVSGFAALRRPSHESTSVGEAIIWKATGVEPLPKSRFFKLFERASHVLFFVFGSFLLIAGISSLFTGF